MPTKLYDEEWVRDTVMRLSDEILADRVPGTGRAILGIRTRGAVLADRIAAELKRRGHDLPLGYIDTTFYRDDLHKGGGLKEIRPTAIGFDVNDRDIVLVDDVLSSGRTVRAAMDLLFDYGRPSCIRLCVMLDRGGREMPIYPNFTGARVDVPKGGFVRLRLAEIDRGDAVYVVGRGEEEPA